MTLGYVGAVDHHLFQIQEFNPGSAQKCLAIAAAFAAAGQPGGGCGSNGADTIYSLNGQNYNGTRPYSVTSGRHLDIGELDFADNPYSRANGDSNYNSLQVTVNKKVGAERFLVGYTLAKSMDDASAYTMSVNPFNAGLSRGLSTFDIRITSWSATRQTYPSATGWPALADYRVRCSMDGSWSVLRGLPLVSPF